MKIAVAGTGYVGLSLAVLLSQHNEVHALDIVPEKVEKINNYASPIQDDEIERFLAEAKAGERELDCTPPSMLPRRIQAPTMPSSPRPPTTTRTGISSTRAPSRPPSPPCAR